MTAGKVPYNGKLDYDWTCEVVSIELVMMYHFSVILSCCTLYIDNFPEP